MPSDRVIPPTWRGPIAAVRAYHEATKHRPQRYARSLGYMDWDSQPNPFRRYEGAPVLPLDEVRPTPEPTYDGLYRGEPTCPAPLDRRFVSQLFYDSLALSAWKAAGEARWALRVNPSSGNLHPTEGYLVCGPVPGLAEEPAVYHYAPHEHALERRLALPATAWQEIGRGLPPGSVLLGLTSIHWREAWKYGERAFRYCQHDVGHAIGALILAAAALGWEVRHLAGVPDPDVAALLGVASQDGTEAEHPDVLLVCFPRGRGFDSQAGLSYRLDPQARNAVACGRWLGVPNRLSPSHHAWEAIDSVTEAAALTAPLAGESWGPPEPGGESAEIAGRNAIPARGVIRQRRSAVDMDGRTALNRDDFFRMLHRVLPTGMPFTALSWRPAIHLVLFVHRVDGLEPGLYVLLRRHDEEAHLHAAMRPEFDFTQPPGCPPRLPLRLLRAGDYRTAAAGVSCGQDIAADGVFAVAMLAEFAPRIETAGPWFYRALHWEAGLVGQVIYLEAEAAGVRATGIGCFFDDSVHQLLGLADDRYQTLYHLTIGGPLEDPRLQTLPAYAHLEHRRPV